MKKELIDRGVSIMAVGYAVLFSGGSDTLDWSRAKFYATKREAERYIANYCTIKGLSCDAFKIIKVTE